MFNEWHLKKSLNRFLVVSIHAVKIWGHLKLFENKKVREYIDQYDMQKKQQ